jgi:hypothetical protein
MSGAFPESDQEAAQLVPADDEPLTAEESAAALDASFDTFRDEDDLVVSVPAPTPVGRGWDFDFAKRRFVIGRFGHGPVETHGETTLKVWIEKCLNTDRGAHPIHSDDYGMERPFDEVGMPLSMLPSSDYERRIREALIFHDRIVDVRDFDLDTDPDDEAVGVTFSVVLDDDTTISIEGLRLI